LKKWIFIIFLGFTAAGCAKRTLSPADTITTAISAPIQTLNPLYTTDADSEHINELTHAGLMHLGEDMRPEPYLAESMKVVDDNTLEFKLRSNCFFSTGAPLRMEDVQASLAFFANPQFKSPMAKNLKHVVRFEPLDKLRFRLHTDKVSPSLLNDLTAIKIIPAESTKNGDSQNVLPGIAPYKVSSFNPTEIRLEKTNSGCLPAAKMPKLVVKVVRDDLSRYLKLQRGELDIVYNEMDYRKIVKIQKDPSNELRVMMGPGIGFNYLGLNLTNPKLSDIRVRRALALSLDIPSIILYKSVGQSTQARNLLSDTNFYANLDIPKVDHNLKEAKRLLDEAGYNNGENKKPPLVLTLKTTTNSIAIENAKVIASQLQEAGFVIDHRAYEWGIFYSDVKKHNVELYLLRWVGITEPGIYFDIFHSGERIRNNRSGYANPEMDKVLEEAQGTLDPQKRKAAFKKAQALVARDLPLIGLWYPENSFVYRKELSDVSLKPNGSWLSFLTMQKGAKQ
jgi:peptide/nickel transport system substrate-binding protein